MDPQPTSSPPPDASTPFIPGPWEASVAGKKIAWALGKFTAAAALAPTIAPKAAGAIDKLSGILEPYGISIVIDQSVFDKSLPILIFGVLVLAHDWAKVKYKLPWL